MKLKQLLGSLAAAIGLSASPAFADIVDVSGTITTTTNWISTNVYVLNGPVYVLSNAVLNIEAGTIIKGQTNSTAANIAALYVCTGGKIFANGTANRPIIFTSILDDIDPVFGPALNLSPFQRGLWGGVVLFGKAQLNTASSSAGNTASPKYDVYEGLPDSVIGGQNVHRFGGNDDDDNSGVLRYVSIRHGGKILESAKEINGLSMGAVGRGTTIEYVEAFAIADDGFEFFGGTVNTKYLVSAFNDDDSFDADQGHRGKHQFWFGIQASATELGGDTSKRDKGFELNGEPQTLVANNLPRMKMVVYNATSMGAGAGSGGSANNTFTIRDAASPSFYNCIFTDFASRGLSISANCTNFINSGELDLRDNIWFGFTGGVNPNSITNISIDNGGVYFTDASRNNTIVDPQLRGISRTNTSSTLDPRPLPGSPATTSERTAPNDGFYTPVCFKGAFDTNDLWTSGWTAVYQYGIVKPRGALTNNVSGTITGVTNWTRDTTYVLNGPVYVLSNAVLNIEAGTIIKGQTNSTAANIAALYVCTGGKIFANGTANSPIIFTSILDDVNDPTDLSPYQRGLWGGVVLFGKAQLNTASSSAGNTASPKYDVYEGLPDSVIGGQNVHRFGGNDDDDNSGVLRYVSIRHGGKILESAKEINGLSMGAVGRGTTIEFVECYAIADDGFEFFGGTVNTRYLVSAFNDDDSFDADQGHRGKHQFWFGIQVGRSELGVDNAKRDKGFELNGEPQTLVANNLPRMKMVVYNATSMGAGAGSGGSANNTFTIRDAASPSFYNCIFTDFASRGLSISANCTNFINSGELDLRDNIWFGFTGGVNPNSITNISIDNGGVYFTDASRNNTIVDPQLRGISRDFGNVLDPRPQVGSPALAGTRLPPTDGFYTPVSYVGAFGANNWAADWTALSEYGILSGAGARVPFETLIEPQLTQVASSIGTNLVVNFATSSGFNYQVQSSTNMSTWVNVGDLVNGSGAVKSYTDGAAGAELKKFYRVRAFKP